MIGVRVGLAAIKGLAEVAGKPAVGVSTSPRWPEFGTSELRAPLIDAKRGEVFAGLFDQAGAEIIPSSVLQFQAFVDLVGDRYVEYISAAFDPGPAIHSAFLPEFAGTIARLAIRRFHLGEPCDPASIEANYVRRSDAEILWKA